MRDPRQRRRHDRYGYELTPHEHAAGATLSVKGTGSEIWRGKPEPWPAMLTTPWIYNRVRMGDILFLEGRWRVIGQAVKEAKIEGNSTPVDVLYLQEYNH